MKKARKPCIVGNWKMMGSKQKITALMQALSHSLPLLPLEVMDIVLCPSFPYLSLVDGFIKNMEKNSKESKDSKDSKNGECISASISLGAQNVSDQPEGAFTGEVSSNMLVDLDCRYVILGHSERRQWLHESNELIARKFRAAYDTGLIPILCVGETEVERNEGRTLEVVSSQLEAVLKEMGAAVFKKALLAYEPVWAIGSGQTATPEQASHVHAYLRNLCGSFSDNVRILYGGSVKANNAQALFEAPNIDGVLVGGASLNAEEFTKICAEAVSS